jgi:hypothetical protein
MNCTANQSGTLRGWGHSQPGCATPYPRPLGTASTGAGPRAGAGPDQSGEADRLDFHLEGEIDTSIPLPIRLLARMKKRARTCKLLRHLWSKIGCSALFLAVFLDTIVQFDLASVGVAMGKKMGERTEFEISNRRLKASLPAQQALAIGVQIRALFSPLVEGAGLIGDYIRLFRNKAALKAMRRVREVAAQHNIALRPLKPKFLIQCWKRFRWRKKMTP